MSPSQLLSHLTTPLSLPNTPVALPPLSLTASSSVTASPTLLTSPSISSADQPMPKLLAQLANAGPAKSDVASLLLSSKPSPAVVSSPPKESPVVVR